ncbi:xanthine dehydrogenase family protein molybdopterin-binding subunit [Streptantibioticus parmotrematis]|uniref:xanthine dehydrogenase family protein molybdopterin-binding subunit n=1 Tax=Streptantibioticus parmotrematis TaxID=2873249 RepID=UPI0033C136C9
MTTLPRVTGEAVARIEARDKVTGAASYAADHPLDGLTHAWPVTATVARGDITAIDDSEALRDPAVLAVLTHANAPRLADAGDPMVAVLRSPHVAHHGQIVALAVAETLEAARAAAGAVRVTYDEQPHDVVLTADRPGLYTPDEVNAGHPADRRRGDFDTAYAASEITVDAVYEVTPLHNHPMEPHAATAVWDGDTLTVFDSNQGSTVVRSTLAALFEVDEADVRVVSEHVGGGFGSKGTPRPHVALAALAAKAVGRPVRLALPRNRIAAVTGHRAPTIQRVRLGADADGHIDALAHETVTQTSTLTEFVEQASVSSRMMYASPHSLTTHRVARLDVPSPSWMRAPGECPGMFALESAMDELAVACGLDPVELRIRNEPPVEPDSGRPFSSRHLVDCLREGARRFGWHDRDPRPAVNRDGPLLIGSGVAASTYPVWVFPSHAEAYAGSDGRYEVRVNATDIGTGARTVLTQIAADALGVPLDLVRVSIGRGDLPAGSVAGGSSGTASWGWPVHKACADLRQRVSDAGGHVPDGGLFVRADTEQEAGGGTEYSRHAFGAQFAEVQVDTVTGEVRVRRMLGVFAAGHILNPRTARSQFIGGMTMGLGMALTEGSFLDPEFGDFTERDLASYHVAACADVPEIDVHWIDEDDPHLNPMGSKGIGEIGIVGAAAALANAVHHATGMRVRRLPIHPDTILLGL